MSDDQAPRTTPSAGRFVEVDDSRTFLVFGVFMEAMVGMALGSDPRALVRLDLTGKWNHGGEDKPVLILTPDLARELVGLLAEGAEAADADLAQWLRTGRVTP